MKLFATIFDARRVEFKLQISPRNAKDSDRPMLYRHRSKRGTESLIFSPTVGLLINPKSSAYDQDTNVLIPLQLIYQLNVSMSAVYNSLSNNKLYCRDSNGKLIMDTKLAMEKFSRKFSVFRTNIIFAPAVIDDEFSMNEKGIAIGVPGKLIGCLTHLESMALIETIERLDISSYTLLSAMAEQLANLDKKSDMILEKLDRIELALRNGISPPIKSTIPEPLLQFNSME